MNVIWYKVWYDLWHNKLRTALVVLSITVGVFAVGATFGFVYQLVPAMDSAHRRSQPSHGTIYLTKPVDREILLALEKIPGVAAIEPLNEVQIRYKVNQEDEWRQGQFVMRDEYGHQYYDVVQIKEGSWPHEIGIAVEKMYAPYLGMSVGDQLIVEYGDQEKIYPVTGIIRHPFVPPPSMLDMAFFFSGEEVMEDLGVPLGDYGQIKFRAQDYSESNARLVASAIKQRLANQNISVVMTVYQDPDHHWGHGVVDGMAAILQVLAVLSLLLSVVLVLNTVTAIITQQTNQIGIMKAVGGSSVSMLKIYLSGILVVGVLSLAIAFPLGTYTAFQLTRWLLGFYNIEYNQFILQPQMIALQAFAALVVPLLAAILPAMHAAGVTVREAIASYGLGGDFGSNWLDRGIEQIGRRFLSSVNAIALANTFRRKGRLALSQLVLVIAGVMFMIVTSLSSSMMSTIDTEFSRRSYDVAIFFEGFQRQDRTIGLAESTDGVNQADMWLVIPVTILREGQKTLDAGTGSRIQGVPLDDPMYTPLIVEGRWLQPGDSRVVVMAQDTAKDENIQVGDVVTLDMGALGEHDWKVVGLYQAFTVMGGDFNPDEIFAPREAVFQASKKTGKGSTLLVRTAEGGEEIENSIGGALETLFEDQQMDVYRIETMTTQQNFMKTSFSIVINMLVVLALIVALVGGIGLMGSMWIGVIERTKEIGIMRAIGARSSIIVRMFILEGIVQGLLSWLIALPVAMLVSPFMSNTLGQAMFQTDLDYSFNFKAALLWLGIVLVISLLAAIIPGRSAARIVIRETLAYE